MLIKVFDANNYVWRLVREHEPWVFRSFINAVEAAPMSIVVWDGVNSREKRQEIYPGYKAHREYQGDNEGIYQSMHLLKELLKLSKCVQIEVPGFEADDVIAAVCSDLSLKHQVHVVSNDRDLLAIPNVTVDAKPDETSMGWIQLKKALVGDKSDNIPGVQNFGEAAWVKCDKTLLFKWIVGNLDFNENHWPKRTRKWISKPENQKLVQNFFKVIQFIPVPEGLIKENTTVGLPRPDLRQPIFDLIMEDAA